MNDAQKSYWRRYYDAETLARCDALREDVTIQSTGVRLHMDHYPQADSASPTLIFNHGGGGNSRFFVPLALALHERGYRVICPNQYGQGYSEGERGDFTLAMCIQNLVDVSQWARDAFDGPLYLGGASLGGGLTYHAAAAGAPVDAIICHNLYDFGLARDALALSRFDWVAQIPGLAATIGGLTSLLAGILPSLHIPFRLMGRFDQMVDQRDTEFYGLWLDDPLPLRWISLRYLRSMMRTPAAIPYEANTLPVLVINPVRDRMTDPAVTRNNYERLGGPKKYVKIPYGHWATSPAFTATYTAILDEFMEMMRQKPPASAGGRGKRRSQTR